ncbi:putative amidoligase domain-containing protein [Brevibacillus sp. 179-C9.3 HS]|uniref:putative amidoligase domain-containing protein n=1 Tax=unclassified Brevibacillus TaxID=2684853 RepID=UPI0039A2DE50
MILRSKVSQRANKQEPPAAQPMTANAKEVVAYLHRPEIGRWLLRQGRIPVAKGNVARPGWRTYRICLYQDHVLDIARSEEQPQWLLHRMQEPDWHPVPLHSSESEVHAVRGLAARSLYAAGADVGQVTIMAASAHRLKVVEVEPNWPANYADEYMQRAREWWEGRMRQQSQKLQSMGADPEFALRKPTGEMALASDFLSINGTVGCDTTRYREELGLHQHPVAELRPAPSEDPDQLFMHIYENLALAFKKIGKSSIEWLAGGMPFQGYPIGGHIHFGGLTPTFALRRKLDAYLALPLVLVEDAGCLRRRERYGFLGDVREKEYGFEYRTLPSWLIHPVMTRGILHLAHLVATNHEKLQAMPHLQLPLIKAYYQGEKEKLLPYVSEVWLELKDLPGYTLSRIHLDRYFSFILEGKSWMADEDLRKAWKLL